MAGISSQWSGFEAGLVFADLINFDTKSGQRATFPDITSTFSTHLDFEPWPTGTPFV